MKSTMIILATTILITFSGYVFAGEGMNQNEKMGSMMLDQKETTTAAKAIEVGNKICPVSGDKIPVPGEKGAMGDKPVKYEYNGKIYNLCCPMCVKDFKKNPGKYSKIADDEVAKEKMMEQKEGPKGTTK